MKIAVGITTTQSRSTVLQLCLNKWAEYLPINAKIFIYVDEELAGISHSKNKTLAMCIDADYIFICDDDIMPNCKDWHVPYIESGLNHACWNLDRKFLSLTQQYIEYETPNGCMLFFTKHVIDQVGGWDTSFNGYGYEHVNLSDRIYNNGLTPARYIDVRNTKGLFTMLHSPSTISSSVRALSIPNNKKLWRTKYLSKEFIPFI